MLSGAAVVRLLTLIRLSTALLRTPVLPGIDVLKPPKVVVVVHFNGRSTALIRGWSGAVS